PAQGQAAPLFLQTLRPGGGRGPTAWCNQGRTGKSNEGTHLGRGATHGNVQAIGRRRMKLAAAISSTYASSATHDNTSFNGPDATGTVISSLTVSSCVCRFTNSGMERRHPSTSSSCQARGGRSDKPRSL